MSQPTSSMTSPEMLEEAKPNASRLVELLKALEKRFEGDPWHQHILISLTLKAQEIEYFLAEIE